MAPALDPLMPAPEASELLAFMHRLCDASGAAILPHYRTPLAAENKAGAERFDPVTAADRAGEAAIRALIAEHYPLHGIVGEEYGTTRPDADHVWVLDPIDGTKAFISGQPIWGTLVALLHRGRAVLGMLDQPFTGERFWGDGRSAFAARAGVVRPLATRRPVDLADAVVWVSSTAARDPAMHRRIERLGRHVRMVQYGADCTTTAMVAEGHVDIAIGYGFFEIYDIAAHVPIVGGAGGIVTGLAGGDPLAADAMMASGDPACHAAALAVLWAPDAD